MKIEGLYSKLGLLMLALNVLTPCWADPAVTLQTAPNEQPLAGLNLGASSTEPEESHSFASKLWGTAAPPAIYLGMVTYHFEPGSRDDRWNNNLVAGTYHGFFAGTLMNSFDDRAFVGGIQRIWASQYPSDNFNNTVGYRLGLISGYDERMAPIAAHTPVLPFPQVYDDMVWHHVGIEFSWCVVTASAGLMYQFS